MTPAEALQYLSQVASDYARGLPPSAQFPTVQAINQALGTLEPFTQPQPLSVEVDLDGKEPRHLHPVDGREPGKKA